VSQMGIRNIYIRQGDTFSHSIVLNYKIPVPSDIEDHFYQSQIREYGYDNVSNTPSGDPVATFSVSEQEVSGSTVRFTCSLSSADSDAVEPGKYLYDVQRVDGDGKIKTVLYGTVVVIPEITP